MPTMKFFALIFALFASAIFASTFPEEEGVLVLGADNFDEAIQEHKNILVEFYAPWCGHCKALAPEYAKAAKALSDSPVKLAKVDATVHNDLGKNFGVKGFPTLKFFKNGKPSDYTGGRTEKEIVNWLNKKVGPATATIASEADLAKFQENNDAFVVGVFASSESEEAKVFQAAADGDELHIYAIATDASVKSKLGVSDNTVVVLKSYDDLRNDLSVNGETTSEDVTKFVGKFSTPWIQEFSQESSKKIFGSPITKHVLFFTNKAADHHKTTLEAYQSVAKEHLGELLFVNIPSTEKKVLEFFDVKEDALPTMILADLGAESGIKKYPFSGAHNAAAINAFIGEFKSGKLQAHLKSEEVAPEDTTGDVIVVKGKSFNDLVVNNDKDVLVEFYAPWCGHCKQLAPTYEELAKTVKAKSSNVVIAKMDATANEVDHPNVNVRGFPTIYFFKGNDKQNPVKYEEKRELEDFLEFLENNVHHKWSNDEL